MRKNEKRELPVEIEVKYICYLVQKMSLTFPVVRVQDPLMELVEKYKSDTISEEEEKLLFSKIQQIKEDTASNNK